MNAKSDAQLLRDYAERADEAAFREVVERHTDFVFSAALRQVESAAVAADLTQSVFIALSRKAGAISGTISADSSLAGWLHRSTRYAVLNHLRDSQRRRTNERRAMDQLLTNSEAGIEWEQIGPALDEAIDSLSDADRESLLLRYFQKKDFRIIGLALGVSHDTAQKRVSRALEKLREAFAKQKITTSAGGLVAMLSVHAVHAAPAGLVTTVSATALIFGTTVHTSSVIAATKAIAMTTIQKASFATAMVVLLGGAIYEAKLAVLLRTQNQKLQQEQAALVEQNQQLQSERENARMRLTELLAENSSLKANPNEKELIRLRGELTRLQSSGNDATAIAAKAWLAKVSKLKQRLQASPGAWIPEMQFLTEQDWLSVTRNNLNTDADFRRALAELRHEGENKLAALAWKPALEGYSQANGGQFPADLSELLPYFVLPVDDTIVQRWKIVPAKDVPNVGVGEMVITQRSAVDELLDSRMAIGANGYGSMDWLTSETQDTLKPVYSSFRNANPNLTSFDPTQLLAFATTSSQRAAVRKLIDQKALKK